MISAVILTKNEENTIVDCLESIVWVDEIIVVDDYSTDRTVELARRLNATVFIRELANDFSSQRNYGLQKAKGDWVLFVDADERVTTDLKNEIIYKIGKIEKNSVAGFNIRRVDYLFGRRLKYGETGNISFLRLARKDAGEWMGRVHEIWNIEGLVEPLESELLHFPHQTIREFLSEINNYTDVRARELLEGKVRISQTSIIVYPLGKFFINYVLKRGFLDGEEGLVFAFFMSFHSFLVRGKLWQLWHRD